MELFSLEAEEENGSLLVFSDIDEDFDAAEIGNFIDHTPIQEESVRFYRERNPLNVDDYPTFNGQTRDPLAAIYENDELFLW